MFSKQYSKLPPTLNTGWDECGIACSALQLLTASKTKYNTKVWKK